MEQISSAQQIEELIRARYILIYVVSTEEYRVLNTLAEIGKSRKRKVLTWTCTKGLEAIDGSESFTDIKDPLRALEFIGKYEDDGIFVLRDFHPYLQDPTVTRRLRDLNTEFKHGTTHKRNVLLLSGILKVPQEIEKDIAVVDFDLPTREQIGQIVDNIISSVPHIELAARTDPEAREHVIDAALGLTAEEANNAIAKALIRTRDLDMETIVHEKKHIIRKSGVLEFYETSQAMAGVGGLEVMKDWLKKRAKSFTQEARDFGLPSPKGILLLGIPGCGKSLSAKAIGHQWQVPLLRLDVGRVFAGLVGQSEENMRKAIKTAEAVAPCVLWLDELEKGFSGTQSSGSTDGGTTSRVFASFITWLQEKQSSVFVIATANNVHMLPPELLRKGRFDEIFFVDLPTAEERRKIAHIHISKKNRDADSFDLDKIVAATQGFSGSEIEQGIISALYDAFEDGVDIDTDRVVKSCQEIIPLSYTMKEGIDSMREWSKSRARAASVITSDEADVAAARQLEI